MAERQPATQSGSERAKQPRQFVHFLFLKVDREWYHLPADERAAHKDAFEAAVQRYSDDGMIVVPYTLVGIRADVDLMLWRITYELEALQRMMTDLRATPMGPYLEPVYGYLSQSKRSVYRDKIDPEHDNQRQVLQPGRYRYNFVYPFVKTRDWYLMSKQARQGVMDEHIQVGVQYPTVKLNTTYSFGLDDQEFMLAFESNEPSDFLDLVMHLRETDGSRFTVRDTPIFTCLRGTLREVLDSLGG